MAEIAPPSSVDRDSLLTFTPIRPARNMLFLIETRTAYLRALSRQARRQFLTEAAAAESELAFFSTFALSRTRGVRPTIQEIERYAAGWAGLVPDNPRLRAVLAHLFAEKYRFPAAQVPGIRAALGWDTPAVQAAYEQFYHQPLAGIYAPAPSGRARLAWAATALAHWFDRQSPFWVAYVLTLTETIGATILALPIAVAGIGPLPGLGILIVLGLVNMLTLAFMSEAVTRSGLMRFGNAFLGRMVGDYLGRTGALILSGALFLIVFLALQAYYIGMADSLHNATGLPPALWIVGAFAVGLYYLRRESLSATVVSALVVSAINIALILILAALTLPHVQEANLRYVHMPILTGGPLDPATFGGAIGVIFAAYFGHLSVGNAGRMMLRRDPSGRALLAGNAAAQATAILFYCLWVAVVNGAIPAARLAAETGTSLTPLAEIGGPLVTILGTIFAVLGMGMASIHYTLALFNLTQEWLPAPASTEVGLPLRRSRLLLRPGFGPYRPPFSAALTYVGMEDGLPCLQVEVTSRGQISRVRAAVNGRWELFGPHGTDPGLAHIPVLQGTRIGLAVDILATSAEVVQIRVHTPMHVSFDHAWTALDQGVAPSSAPATLPPRRRGGELLPRLLARPRGRFIVGILPVIIAFLMTEWAVLTGTASFTSLLGFLGVAVVALLAGIFPVLLLVVARRKGEFVPQPTYRFLGNPLLLGGIYGLSVGLVAVHGIWIWQDPPARAGALVVSAIGLGLPIALWRRGLFARRLVIELCADSPPGPAPTVGITSGGQATPATIRLAGAGGPVEVQTANGPLPAGPDLHEIIIRPPWDARTAPADLKVWVHTVNAAGDSSEWPARVTIRQDGAPPAEAATAPPDGILIHRLAPAPAEVVIQPSPPDTL